MEDIDILKKNCLEYDKTHSKAISVLKKADGNSRYFEIAKVVGLHNTKVSSLLKKAEKLGLVEKNKLGNYKKKTGILSYMPKNKTKITKLKSIPDIMKKIKKPKNNKPPVYLGLKVPSKIESNLGKMSDAYIHLFTTENILRSLIRKVLDKKIDWWKNNIPSGIQTSVKDEILRTSYLTITRSDELEYTHLGQLKEIITCNMNWSDFLPFLKEKNKNAFSATIDKAIPSRNALGHCIPLTHEDIKVVGVRFSDILNMLE